MYNRFIKQELGAALVVGLEGDENFIKEWITGFHNYGVSDTPHRMTHNFCFFLTNKTKFINGLRMYYYHKFYLDGVCPAGQYWVLAMQEAKRTYEGIKEESFYTNLLKEDNRNRGNEK